MGVCGVVVDDVECVLCVVVGVEYGSGEDLGGFGEVLEGVDFYGVCGGGWGLRGLGDEVAVWCQSDRFLPPLHILIA